MKGFPTSLFLNPDGSEIKRLVGAPPTATAFIYFAKQVTGEEKDFLEIFKQYEEGNKDLDFIRSMIINSPVYIATLPREKQEEWWKKIDEIKDWYFAVKRPEQMLNKDDFDIISMFFGNGNNGNPFVEFVYNHYEEYKKIVPVSALSMFVMRNNNLSIHDSYQKGNLKFNGSYLGILLGH